MKFWITPVHLKVKVTFEDYQEFKDLIIPCRTIYIT